MQNVDQTKLKALEQRAYQVNAEVKSLCANKKRKQAHEKAMSFAEEMANDPTMQTVRKCGEIVKEIQPMMPFMNQPKDRSSHHVCD